MKTLRNVQSERQEKNIVKLLETDGNIFLKKIYMCVFGQGDR